MAITEEPSDTTNDINYFNCDEATLDRLCGPKIEALGYEGVYQRAISDFECSRKCNIHRLQQLYESELRLYYDKYNNYLSYKYNTKDLKKRAEAEQLERVIENIKLRLNKILNELNDNIEKSNNDIENNKKEIQNRNFDISNTNKDLTNQYNTILEKKNELEGKLRMIETGTERNNYKRNTIIFLIFLNIFIICTLAALIVYK